jgi:methyl-accepting chemotaxis protein
MLYGRRILQSQQWLYRSGPLKLIRVIDSSFQWKYTFYLTAAMASASFIFLGPAWYFVHQNYDIFISLADKSEPMLFEHLQRESAWLLTFLVISGLVILGLSVFLGLRLTESIMGPFVSLQRHMRNASRGDLTQRDFKIRATDDFRALASTYAYLYKSLKAQAEQDLKWLEKITIDPNNRDALAAWQALVRTKQSQLGQTKEILPMLETDSSVSNVEFPETRRAS